jgi:16S rRNA processing protein RimM
LLGRISGLFGVKGWVKIFSYTRPREAILDYSRWYLKRKEGWQPATVCEGQKHGKSVIVHFDGIDDRDKAAELIECEIAISRDEMPTAEEGSYYWADLEGLRVVHRDGTELGHVAYMMETGANDVMVTAGERERLIPFIADKVVLGVDFDKGEISVDWEWD